MKKVLSLVLAFAMILGSFGFVFASDFSDVKDTEYYSEPVNVLSGLGVIAGFPDGTFKPADQVTRAQMATMITAALGIPVKGSGATGFSDVPASHWASGYIAYAVSVGFVAGYPDKTFKPENPVSYNEALTMIVAALGYTAESLPGTWPGAFINKARGLGILDTCKTTGNAAAPRQDIACFLYDALDQSIGYVDKDGAFQENIGANGVKGGDTMMARLGAKPYKSDETDADGFFVVTGTEPSDINLKNYLGAFASAYMNKDGDIIAIKEIKSEFISGDFDDIKDDYNIATTAEYKKGDPATSAFVYFENGDVNKDKGYSNIAGDVKLAVKMSGKKISTIYSSQVWDNADTFQFTKDMADEIIDDLALNAHAFAKDDNDEIDASEFALLGVDSLADIKEDAVVTVYEGTDNTISRIEVSTKTVSGVITKIGKDKDEYTIGGTVYGLNAKAESKYDDLKALMEDETSATYYLDYNDDIYTHEADKPTTSHYAVVLKAGYEDGRYAGDTTNYITLFLADGKSGEFTVENIEHKDENGVVTETIVKDGAWDSTIEAGVLVKYTIDEDNVITDIVVADGTKTGGFVFNAKGVCVSENAALKDSTVAFNFTNATVNATEKAKAANYEVLTAKDLYEAEGDALYYAASDENEFNAVLTFGMKATDTKYAIFVKAAGSNKDGELWTALYDGEVATLTVKEGKVKAENTYTSGEAIKLSTLTFNASEIVTDIVTKTRSTSDFVKEADLTNGAISVSKSGILTDGNSDKFTLADDVVFYIYDGSSWTAKTSFEARKGTYKQVWLVDTTDKTTSDNEYDIVIVIKK